MALSLRDVNWLVTGHIAEEPLLGQPLLKALEVNTRSIPAATAERHADLVNVGSLFHRDGKENISEKLHEYWKTIFMLTKEPTTTVLSDLKTASYISNRKTAISKKEHSTRSSRKQEEENYQRQNVKNSQNLSRNLDVLSSSSSTWRIQLM